MQQWLDSQISIQKIFELNAREGVPLDYWVKKDGGKVKTFGELDEEEMLEHLNSLKDARVYEIDGRVQRAFVLTPNKTREIEIPFPKLFINSLIEFNDLLVIGILLEKNNVYDDGDILIRILTKKYPDKPDGVSALDYSKRVKRTELESINTWAIWLNKPRPEIEKEIKKESNGDLMKLLRRTVMNFNDFLEHPEVTVIERTRNNNEKRIKRGKPALPNSTIIKVTGELKIYLNSVKNEDSDDNMGKCFEVAGYWKTYRHERYTKKSGKRQFIHPYIKGAGVPDRRIRKIDNSIQHKKNLLRGRDNRKGLKKEMI